MGGGWARREEERSRLEKLTFEWLLHPVISHLTGFQNLTFCFASTEAICILIVTFGELVPFRVLVLSCDVVDRAPPNRNDETWLPEQVAVVEAFFIYVEWENASSLVACPAPIGPHSFFAGIKFFVCFTVRSTQARFKGSLDTSRW